jgi:hypothetical protein
MVLCSVCTKFQWLYSTDPSHARPAGWLVWHAERVPWACLLDPYLHALMYCRLSFGSLAPSVLSQPKSIRTRLLKPTKGHGIQRILWTPRFLVRERGAGWEWLWSNVRHGLAWSGNRIYASPNTYCSLDFVDLSVFQKILLVIVYAVVDWWWSSG